MLKLEIQFARSEKEYHKRSFKRGERGEIKSKTKISRIRTRILDKDRSATDVTAVD